MRRSRWASKPYDAGNRSKTSSKFEELARLIAGELEVLKIELSALIVAAAASKRPRPRRAASIPSRLVATAGMVGGGTFGAILYLISFLEVRAQRINSLDDVEHKLGIKVIWNCSTSLPKK